MTLQPSETVQRVLDEVGHLLALKGRSYGNSAFEPLGIFSKHGAEAGLRARIDDKLARIKHSPGAFAEDTELDLLGYLVLLRAVRLVNQTPGLLTPGTVKLLAGQTGSGKSLLALDLAARVTRGESWPGAPGASAMERAPVALLDAFDDAADTIVPRFTVAGGDPGLLHLIQPGRATPRLEAALRVAPKCALLIVDPIEEFTNRIEPLKRFASKHGCAVLATTNLRRATYPPGVRLLNLTLDKTGQRILSGPGIRAAFTLEIDASPVGPMPRIRWSQECASPKKNN